MRTCSYVAAAGAIGVCGGVSRHAGAVAYCMIFALIGVLIEAGVVGYVGVCWQGVAGNGTVNSRAVIYFGVIGRAVEAGASIAGTGSNAKIAKVMAGSNLVAA